MPRSIRESAAWVGGLAFGLLTLGAATILVPNGWMAAAVGFVLSWSAAKGRWCEPTSAPYFGVATGAGLLGALVLTNDTTTYANFGNAARLGLASLAFCIFIFASSKLGGAKVSGWVWTTLALVVVLGFAGSSRGGVNTTLAILRHLGFPKDLAVQVVGPLRKSIHFIYFGCIAFSSFKASPREKFEARTLAMVVAICLACFDELHQRAFANRTASGWDVLLDTAGAVTFVFLARRPAPERPKLT